MYPKLLFSQTTHSQVLSNVSELAALLQFGLDAANGLINSSHSSQLNSIQKVDWKSEGF